MQSAKTLELLDVSATEYHSWEAISNSKLSMLLTSPKLFDYYRTHPFEETDSMRLGTETHCLLLEPNKFKEYYSVIPDVSLATKAGKILKASALDKNPGTRVIKQAEYDKARYMADQILLNKEAAKLFEGCLFERSVRTKRFGNNVKARFDGINLDKKYIFDVKTTQSIKKFILGFEDLGYHRQAAFYCDVTGFNDFYFIVVESNAPHITAVFKLKPKSMERGRMEISAAFEMLKTCRKNKDFRDPFEKQINELEINSVLREAYIRSEEKKQNGI